MDKKVLKNFYGIKKNKLKINKKWRIKQKNFEKEKQHLFKNPLDYIPKDTIYCYTPTEQKYKVKRCPFWSKESQLIKCNQDNGYCYLIKKGDWQDGFSILWDSCKECGLNDDYDEDLY